MLGVGQTEAEGAQFESAVKGVLSSVSNFIVDLSLSRIFAPCFTSAMGAVLPELLSDACLPTLAKGIRLDPLAVTYIFMFFY